MRNAIVSVLIIFLALDIYASEKPVVVLLEKDVILKPCDPVDGIPRGVLCSSNVSKAETLKKGTKIKMVKDEGEGACSIDLEGKKNLLVDCPWLEGHKDMETDFFKVLGKK